MNNKLNQTCSKLIPNKEEKKLFDFREIVLSLEKLIQFILSHKYKDP